VLLCVRVYVESRMEITKCEVGVRVATTYDYA